MLSQKDLNIIDERISKIDTQGVINLSKKVEDALNDLYKQSKAASIAVVLDEVINVLKKHQAVKGLANEQYVDEFNNSDLLHILGCVTDFCKTVEKAKGYQEYRRIIENARTERGSKW